jgi:carboxyl-terminal processing protease
VLQEKSIRFEVYSLSCFLLSYVAAGRGNIFKYAIMSPCRTPQGFVWVIISGISWRFIMSRNTMLGLFAAAVAIWLCFDAGSLQGAGRPQDVYDSLKTFSDVLTLVQTNFVGEVDPKKLIQDAIQGMVSRLDPHSSYMPPDVYKEMQVETKGSFGGVGIEITVKDDVLTVVAPIEDSPAFNVGIKTGDRIVKIENESTKNMTLMDAVKKMRGKPGSLLHVSIMRENFQEPKVFSLKRDTIKIKCVKVKKLDDQFFCIRISQFQETTAEEFRKALKTIKTKAPSIKGIVLDMRGNPGGLLDQAVKIADEFIDDGLIVYTEGRTDNQRMQFFAKKDMSAAITCPVVVLVNSGSASASEIVAGALQDHNKAILVGTQTFGKGTVQTIYPLGDGSGLRITTAKYYTPSHRSIQEKGITPDVTVEDTLDIFSPTDKHSKTFREKDLVSQFKDGDTGEGQPRQKDQVPEETGTGAVKDSQPGKKDDKDKSDKPMDTALSILKNWETFRKSLGKNAA